MSMSEYDTGMFSPVNQPPIVAPQAAKALQRIAEVRRQQSVSLRKVARRTRTDIRTLRQEEDETSDLRISRLYEWQKALEVPIADLLIDSDAPLSTPVLERARLVRVMKTVAAILETAQSPSIQRMAQMLAEQLVEIMPELKDVSPWHSVGQRRTLDEYGRVAEFSYSEDIWRNL